MGILTEAQYRANTLEERAARMKVEAVKLWQRVGRLQSRAAKLNGRAAKLIRQAGLFRARDAAIAQAEAEVAAKIKGDPSAAFEHRLALIIGKQAAKSAIERANTEATA